MLCDSLHLIPKRQRLMHCQMPTRHQSWKICTPNARQRGNERPARIRQGAIDVQALKVITLRDRSISSVGAQRNRSGAWGRTCLRSSRTRSGMIQARGMGLEVLDSSGTLQQRDVHVVNPCSPLRRELRDDRLAGVDDPGPATAAPGPEREGTARPASRHASAWWGPRAGRRRTRKLRAAASRSARPDIPFGGCDCDRSFRPRRHRHGRNSGIGLGGRRTRGAGRHGDRCPV